MPGGELQPLICRTPNCGQQLGVRHVDGGYGFTAPCYFDDGRVVVTCPACEKRARFRVTRRAQAHSRAVECEYS